MNHELYILKIENSEKKFLEEMLWRVINLRVDDNEIECKKEIIGILKDKIKRC